MGNAKDLTGLRYGRLVAIERAPNSKSGRTVWKCRCDCGNEKCVLETALQQGLTKSCGCLRPGLRNTRLYSIWSHMKQRCENPNSNRFCYYGARGIVVCSEWKDDFLAFYQWAMNNGYDDALSIDRIDTNGNYEPSNCRWATATMQNRNRRPTQKRKVKLEESSCDQI